MTVGSVGLGFFCDTVATVGRKPTLSLSQELVDNSGSSMSIRFNESSSSSKKNWDAIFVYFFNIIPKNREIKDKKYIYKKMKIERVKM